MLIISKIYELYLAPTAGVLEGHPDEEYHEGGGGIAFDPTGGIDSVEEFPRSI